MSILKGKDLNQELLTKLAHKMNVIGEDDMLKELVFMLKNKTLTEIISETLWFTHDMYQTIIFDKNDLVEINDILVMLRRE